MTNRDKARRRAERIRARAIVARKIAAFGTIGFEPDIAGMTSAAYSREWTDGDGNRCLIMVDGDCTVSVDSPLIGIGLYKAAPGEDVADGNMLIGWHTIESGLPAPELAELVRRWEAEIARAPAMRFDPYNGAVPA